MNLRRPYNETTGWDTAAESERHKRYMPFLVGLPDMFVFGHSNLSPRFGILALIVNLLRQGSTGVCSSSR